MKIVSWNVNGLRAVLKKNFMEYLTEENPDIFCIQETKLQEAQIPQEILELQGYHSYWNFAERKGYSGVAVFTRQKPISVVYSIGDADFDHEGRLLLLEFEDFSLINCYFPNG
ncbi:MAG: endonuclease/exonuclease/phosphatase family protein, partial [Candidatus Cloacimonetes bacterium]|nr:endonuclease/exonuclease/phosphatase family protein [Candidatus Cloacimonadota bacterium]